MGTEKDLLVACSELLSKIMECPENKKCFDCTDTNSPRYLCTNFLTFVCSCCANIHQEFGHTIKCLNVFTFNLSEIYLLKQASNEAAAEKWLAKWSPEEYSEPDPTSPTYREEARAYIRMKYIDKTWCLEVDASLKQFQQQHDDKGKCPGSPTARQFSARPQKSSSPSPFTQNSASAENPRTQRLTSSPNPFINPMDNVTDNASSSQRAVNMQYHKPLPPRPDAALLGADSNSHPPRGRMRSRTGDGSPMRGFMREQSMFMLSPPTSPFTAAPSLGAKEEPVPHPGMLRSCSENALGRHLRDSSPNADSAHNNHLSSTHLDKMRQKWKAHGIISKMSGLLSPKKEA